jgi:predicted AAA+ superfamily ATPase
LHAGDHGWSAAVPGRATPPTDHRRAPGRGTGHRPAGRPLGRQVDAAEGCRRPGRATALVEFGHLLETFCVNEIIKQLSWLDERYTVGHWRTHDGAEVDLVIEEPDGRVTGIEVEASGRVTSSDAAGLRVLRDALGASFSTGVVLHLGPHAHTLDDRIYAVPVDRLWTP